jgi:hypothetical protein
MAEARRCLEGLRQTPKVFPHGPQALP